MARVKNARIRTTGLQPVQLLVGLIGLVFLVAGIIGLTRTGFGDFAGHHNVRLLGFAINPLHNTVHLVAGLLGVLMATGSGLARTYGWLLFLGYGALAVWGLMITGTVSSNPVSNAGNPLDLNTPDNWLHFGVAFVGLVIALLPARKTIHIPEEEVTETAPVAETEHAPITETTRTERAPITDSTATVDPATEELPAKSEPEPTGRHAHGRLSRWQRQHS